MEIKHVKEISQLTVKEQTGDSDYKAERRIEAVASTFGPRETADGRFFNYTKEAFDTLLENQPEVPMYVQHNDGQTPAGVWENFRIDGDKLIAEGRFFDNGPGNDIREVLLNSNVMEGVSVGLQLLDYEIEEMEGDTFIKVLEAQLVELSIVQRPANTAASITSVESCLVDGEVNKRTLEKLLREEVGLSNSKAVSAVAIFTKILEAQSDSVVESVVEVDVNEALSKHLNTKLLNYKLSNIKGF